MIRKNFEPPAFDIAHSAVIYTKSAKTKAINYTLNFKQIKNTLT